MVFFSGTWRNVWDRGQPWSTSSGTTTNDLRNWRDGIYLFIARHYIILRAFATSEQYIKNFTAMRRNWKNTDYLSKTISSRKLRSRAGRRKIPLLCDMLWKCQSARMLVCICVAPLSQTRYGSPSILVLVEPVGCGARERNQSSGSWRACPTSSTEVTLPSTISLARGMTLRCINFLTACGILLSPIEHTAMTLSFAQ